MPSGSRPVRNWSAGPARRRAGTSCCSMRCGRVTPAMPRNRCRGAMRASRLPSPAGRLPIRLPATERGNDRLVEAHHQFWPSEEAMSEGSPQLILERGEPVDTPPALIMQGTADDNLTPDMAADFAAAYTKAGGSIAFHKFDGQPHAFIPRDPASPDARRALGLITDFIHHQTR